jgi:hypothetical protein
MTTYVPRSRSRSNAMSNTIFTSQIQAIPACCTESARQLVTCTAEHLRDHTTIDHDALIYLDIHEDGSQLPVFDLKTLVSLSVGLLGLHEVAHAANGDDTLGIMYTSSNVDPELQSLKQRFCVAYIGCGTFHAWC